MFKDGRIGIPGWADPHFVEKKTFSTAGNVVFNNLKGDTERYILSIIIQASATQGQYFGIKPNSQNWSGPSYSFAGNGDFSSINEKGGGLLLGKVPNNTNNLVVGGLLLLDFRANTVYRHGIGLFSLIGGAGTGGLFSSLNGTGVSGMTSLQIFAGNNISGSIELYKVL